MTALFAGLTVSDADGARLVVLDCRGQQLLSAHWPAPQPLAALLDLLEQTCAATVHLGVAANTEQILPLDVAGRLQHRVPMPELHRCPLLVQDPWALDPDPYAPARVLAALTAVAIAAASR